MKNFSNSIRGLFSSQSSRKSPYSRIISLFAVGAFLRLLSKIPLPFVDYSLLPLSNRPCFLALGILPIVQASLLVQVFNSIKPKTDEDDLEKSQKNQKQIKIVSTVISTIFSINQVKVLTPIMSSYTISSKCILGLSLIMGGLVLIWISDWISETYTISGSVVALTFTSVIDDVIRLISEASNFDFNLKITFALYIIAVAAFTTFISKSTIEFPILSSKQSYSDLEQSQTSILPFAINPGAVMALVSAESLVRIIQSGFLKISFISFNPFFSSLSLAILRFLLIVIFSYYCSKLQVDSDKVAKELITMNMTILRKSPGQETQYYLENELKKTYLSAGFLLGLLVFFSDLVDSYYPVLSLKANLSSLLILFGTMLDLEDRLFNLGIVETAS